jgi:hypothetical protein
LKVLEKVRENERFRGGEEVQGSRFKVQGSRFKVQGSTVQGSTVQRFNGSAVHGSPFTIREL